jgi:tetratricopeptide (TPR) repeat protein
MIFWLLIMTNAFALGPPSVDHNNKGVDLFKSEDYATATKEFNEALGRDSNRPEFHFNMGNSFLKNGDVEKALQEFESVDKNIKSSPEIKFKSMFNAGAALVESKKIKEGLAYYQRALEYDPNSKEVKTNIELALKEQQGGGGGGGGQNNQPNQNKDKKDDKNKEDQKGDKDDQDQKSGEKKTPQGGQEPPRPQKKQFKSQSLSEGEVRQIIEELRRQEENIRAKADEKKKKRPQDTPGKDW